LKINPASANCLFGFSIIIEENLVFFLQFREKGNVENNREHNRENSRSNDILIFNFFLRSFVTLTSSSVRQLFLQIINVLLHCCQRDMFYECIKKKRDFLECIRVVEGIENIHHHRCVSQQTKMEQKWTEMDSFCSCQIQISDLLNPFLSN